MSNAVKTTVESLGVKIGRDEGHELACYCPFHGNTESPALYINKDTGLWLCFNPSCAKKGDLRRLAHMLGKDVENVVVEITDEDMADIVAMLSESTEVDDEWGELIDSARLDFSVTKDRKKAKYLIDRGFEIRTLERFGIGFSEMQNRLIIPVYNEHSRAVGVIGRAIDETLPKYKYSKHLPRRNILFNLNNAKLFSSVIIVEGSLDAMKVWQAGYENVVSSLGATLTEEHIELLNSYFDEVIIFSDNDAAGFSMRDKVVAGCAGLNVRVVKYNEGDPSDPGEMNSEQIAAHIDSAIWELSL